MSFIIRNYTFVPQTWEYFGPFYTKEEATNWAKNNLEEGAKFHIENLKVVKKDVNFGSAVDTDMPVPPKKKKKK